MEFVEGGLERYAEKGVGRRDGERESRPRSAGLEAIEGKGDDNLAERESVPSDSSELSAELHSPGWKKVARSHEVVSTFVASGRFDRLTISNSAILGNEPEYDFGERSGDPPAGGEDERDLSENDSS